ncbi:hypothetical protein V3C99_002703 [Haemonchus contortus]|uniref:Activin_recp domain-containing protein n=1 Tax=Haemonchus contortus TaxID=6289 RepID=A0A7I4YA58_HAECO|nr:TGF-beta receptor activin receptor domain containing protein [Haemonchus contortus]
MRSTLVCIFLSIIAVTEALKCYVGSKGVISGKLSSNFVESVCEEEMIHCFESYSDDFSEITASCQTPNTEQKLLNVCNTGCQNYPTLNVTVCCCDTDLCNLPDSEKPTLKPVVNPSEAAPVERLRSGPLKLSKSL